MTLDRIIVIIVGVAGIIATYWYFLMKKDEEVTAVADAVDIIVEGGYTPSTIILQKDKTVTLSFTRKDQSSCLEEVVLPEFKIRKYLPLNETVTIPVTPKKTGEFFFSCGMNMYHGKIFVK